MSTGHKMVLVALLKIGTKVLLKFLAKRGII
jgi:hypothetical protein